jgi:hypothetical protein
MVLAPICLLHPVSSRSRCQPHQDFEQGTSDARILRLRGHIYDADPRRGSHHPMNDNTPFYFIPGIALYVLLQNVGNGMKENKFMSLLSKYS